VNPKSLHFAPCPACQRAYADQIELLKQRLSNQHWDWSKVRLRDRAVIEYGKGARAGEVAK
jgi:hypothetical protein